VIVSEALKIVIQRRGKGGQESGGPEYPWSSIRRGQRKRG